MYIILKVKNPETINELKSGDKSMVRDASISAVEQFLSEITGMTEGVIDYEITEHLNEKKGKK
jgi:hypothetical protein